MVKNEDPLPFQVKSHKALLTGVQGHNLKRAGKKS